MLLAFLAVAEGLCLLQLRGDVEPMQPFPEGSSNWCRFGGKLPYWRIDDGSDVAIACTNDAQCASVLSLAQRCGTTVQESACTTSADSPDFRGQMFPGNTLFQSEEHIGFDFIATALLCEDFVTEYRNVPSGGVCSLEQNCAAGRCLGRCCTGESPNCESCTESGECGSCEAGYELLDGSCAQTGPSPELQACKAVHSFPTNALQKARNGRFQQQSWEVGCDHAELHGDVAQCRMNCEKPYGCCGGLGCRSNSCSGGGCCDASRNICMLACDTYFDLAR